MGDYFNHVDFTNFFVTISAETMLRMNRKNNVYIQEVTIYDLSNRSHHSLFHLKFNMLNFTLWTHLEPTFRHCYLQLRQ